MYSNFADAPNNGTTKLKLKTPRKRTGTEFKKVSIVKSDDHNTMKPKMSRSDN